MKGRIVYILMFLMPLGVLGQESADCETILKNATKMYEEGVIEGVPDTLANCVPSLSDEDKITAYRLLINTHLYDDQKHMAEDYMVKLLLLKPDYEPTTLDTKEFKDLFNEYNNDPRWSFSAFAGGNSSMLLMFNEFGVHDVNNDLFKPQYTSRLGFSFGMGADRHIMHNGYLSAEVQYTQLTYDYYSQVFDFSRLDFTENQDHLMVRLNAVYYFGKTMNRFRPSVKAGGTAGLIMDADAEFRREYTDLSQGIVSGSQENVGNTKNRLNYWANFSAAANYRLGKHHVFVEFRYNMALNNMIDNSKRYDNPNVIHKYYYVDDDYLMNYISILTGFRYSLYKPRNMVNKKKK